MIEDVTIDAPKNGEVRVKMVSAGICASDAHFGKLMTFILV